MATYTPTRIVDPTVLVTAPSSAVYTVPATGVNFVVIKQLRLSLIGGKNVSDTAAWTILPASANGTLDGNHRQADGVPVAVGSPVRDNVFAVLSPGDQIWASSGLANSVVITVDGIVVTP